MKIPTWYKWSNLLLVRYFLPHCGCRRSQSWPKKPLFVLLLIICLLIFLPMFGSLFDSYLCLGRGTMPGSLKTALPWARNKRNITWRSYMINEYWQGFTVMYNFQKIIWRRKFSFKKICHLVDAKLAHSLCWRVKHVGCPINCPPGNEDVSRFYCFINHFILNILWNHHSLQNYPSDNDIVCV